MFRQGWWAVHRLPYVGGEEEGGKFKHAWIFLHHAVIFYACILHVNTHYQINYVGNPFIILSSWSADLCGKSGTRVECREYQTQVSLWFRFAIHPIKYSEWQNSLRPRNLLMPPHKLFLHCCHSPIPLRLQAFMTWEVAWISHIWEIIHATSGN